MLRKRDPHGNGWKEYLAFGGFGVVTLGLLAAMVFGGVPFLSTIGVIFLLCAGFAVAGLSLLPVWAKAGPRVPGPTLGMWVFILAGLALWCAAPVVGVLAGGGWGLSVGGPGRQMPIWMLAILTWGTTAFVLYALVRQILRKRRR